MARIADDEAVFTNGGDIAPGESRYITVRNKRGDPIKTITLFRTTRAYVYDLADAYNAARTDEAVERGAQWFVNAGGELKLGDNRTWAREHRKRIETANEAERSRFNRAYLESQANLPWNAVEQGQE